MGFEVNTIFAEELEHVLLDVFAKSRIHFGNHVTVDLISENLVRQAPAGENRSERLQQAAILHGGRRRERSEAGAEGGQ
jgi:hypothetical protein